MCFRIVGGILSLPNLLKKGVKYTPKNKHRRIKNIIIFSLNNKKKSFENNGLSHKVVLQKVGIKMT